MYFITAKTVHYGPSSGILKIDNNPKFPDSEFVQIAKV